MISHFLKSLAKVLLHSKGETRWDLVNAIISLASSWAMGRKRFYFSGIPCSYLDDADTLGMLLEIKLLGLYDVPISAPRLIIDCGGNIGIASLIFAQRFPSADILCFEPSRRAFAVLEENVQDNTSRITAINAALGKHEGSVNLYSTTGFSLNMRLVSPGPGDSSEQVRMVMLSNYIKGPVDLLKIDVEGSEHAILDDLDANNKLRLIKNIVVEADWNMPAPSYHFSALLGILEKNGFAYNLKAGASYWKPQELGEYQTVIVYASRKDIATSRSD